MAEKNDSGDKKKKELDPETRFRYVGFEVYPGKKVKDLFKGDADKEKWVSRVRDKREKGGRIREHNQFDVPRVAGYEKIILTITSLILIASLFMPWFSGYTEYEVAAQVPETAALDSALADSSMVDSLTDSLGFAAAPADSMMTPGETETVDSSAAMAVAAEEGPIAESETEILDKDEAGFSSITAIRKKKEIKKEYVSYSAIGALGLLGSDGGKIFSSGLGLIITALLLLVYMVLCVLSAIYTLYNVYGGGKKDADEKALRLKRSLRVNWIPVAIWAFCLIISVAGAAYSFDTTDMIKQLGSSYGIGTFLSLMSYGFYISLAAFIMNAVKAVEI